MSCQYPLLEKGNNYFSEQRIIEISWAPTWEQEELLNEWEGLKRRVSKY